MHFLFKFNFSWVKHYKHYKFLLIASTLSAFNKNQSAPNLDQSSSFFEVKDDKEHNERIFDGYLIRSYISMSYL